jgi:hypothetical protein
MIVRTLPCKYAVASSEAYVMDDRTNNLRKVENPPRDLCAWALFDPHAPAKLLDVPPHVSRNAIAGHLMAADDCLMCPCYEPGDPVE